MKARRNDQLSFRGGQSVPIALTRRTGLKFAAVALGAPSFRDSPAGLQHGPQYTPGHRLRGTFR